MCIIYECVYTQKYIYKKRLQSRLSGLKSISALFSEPFQDWTTFAKMTAKVGPPGPLCVSRGVPGIVLGGLRDHLLGKYMLSCEKVNPSISIDPTMFFITFSVPEPPGRQQNEKKRRP